VHSSLGQCIARRVLAAAESAFPTGIETSQSISPTLFLPLVFNNWQLLPDLPGLSFDPPSDWHPPVRDGVPLTSTNDITGTAAMRLVSPNEAHFMDIIVDWFVPPPPESVFGNMAMPPNDRYEETVRQLSTGELVQVMRATMPMTGSVSVLYHAAFRSASASYSLGVYGEDLNERVWNVFSDTLASMTPNPETLPQSSQAAGERLQTESDVEVSLSSTTSVQAVSYDRDAAVNYANTFVNVFGNSDGCYLWWNGSSLSCSYLEGYWGVDGAHFVNRALGAGGLSIPGLWSGVALRSRELRSWLLANGGQEVGNLSDLQPGDVIFFGTNGCWGWEGLVVDRNSPRPRVHLHSLVSEGVTRAGVTAYYDQITRNNCGSTNRYSFVHIDTVQEQPAPLIALSLRAYPSTPFAGQPVQTSFRLCNYGGAPFDTNRLYVRTTAPGLDFPSVDPPSLAPGNPGGCYDYSQTSTAFPSAGWYTIRAGYADGGFHTLGTVAGQVNEQAIYVASHEDIQLQGDMAVSPDVVQQGESASVQFTVRNIGSGMVTDRFRVRIYDSDYPAPGSLVGEFPESGDETLSPGGTYTYNESYALGIPGTYWIVGEHWAGGNWLPVYGNSTRLVRVMYPMPSKPELAKGMPPYIALAGEPVNTGTGNFVHEHTDLVIPLPGISFDLTRYYNHFDADEVVGLFGHGWTWSLGWHIEWRSDKSAVLTYPDGREAYFLGELDPDDPFDMAGRYVGQMAETQVITRAADGTGILEGNDRLRYEFSADGRLIRIRNGAESGFDVDWNGAGQIEHMTHTSGAVSDFAYTDGYITAINSSDGYSLNYTYSSDGDLLSATSTANETIRYTYDDQHRMKTIEDTLGNCVVLNNYDDENRVVEQVDASDVHSYFDYPPDNVAVFYDQAAVPITHTYNSDLQVTRIEDARGAVTTFKYDADYNRIEEIDPLGGVWRWAYDGHGRVISSTNPLGATWVYTYDVRGNRIAERNPLDWVKRYEYDQYDNPILEIDADSGKTVREYNDQGLMVREIDPVSATREFAYNGLGLPVVITDSLGGVSTMAYDVYGNRTSYTDAEGRTTYASFDDAGRMTSTTSPSGAVITFTHDANGNLLSESDGMGHVRTFGYDEQDRIITRTDYLGNVWSLEYDKLDRVIRKENPVGGVITYTHDAVGNVIARRDERQGIWHYRYDLGSNKTAEIDPLGHETRYEYDAAGRCIATDRPCESCTGGCAIEYIEYDLAGNIVTRTNGRGYTTRYKYDRVGRKVKEIDPLGYETEYVYNDRGDLMQIIDPLDNVTYREYNPAGWVITETNRLGRSTVRSYDLVGDLISVRDARGYVTRYRYDDADNVVQEINALGEVTRYGYDLCGNVLTMTDALSRTTIYAYDANGNRTSRTDPRGFTTYHAYDPLGNRTTITDPMGIALHRVYDAAGDMRSETDGEGNTTFYDYDLLGRRTVITDARGFVTHRAYNADGYLAIVTDALGNQAHYYYDSNGNKVKAVQAVPPGGSEGDGQISTWIYDPMDRVKYFTDALGNRTEYCYDELGHLYRTIGPRGETNNWSYDAEGQETNWMDPLGEVTEYAYDEVGSRTVVTNPRRFTTRTIYDALNRPVQVIDALGESIYYEYDPVGNMSAFTDTRGAVTQYTYDPNNNPITITSPISGVLQTEYNANDWPIAERDAEGHWRYTSYDHNGQVTIVTDTLGHVTRYERDANDNVIGETDPLGHTTRYGYDPLNQRTVVTDALGYTEVITYDAAGNVVARRDERGNVWRTEYDLLNRPITITEPLTGTIVLGYDEAGNVITRTDQADNVTLYRYNFLNQLKREIDPLGSSTLYDYDEVGNLVRKVNKRWTPTCYAYDALNRRIRTIVGSSDCSSDSSVWPTSLYTYDSTGNLIAWRDANGNWARMGYDEMGRLISETNPLSVTQVYTYDLNGRLVARQDGNGDVITHTYDARGEHTATTYPDGRAARFEYDPAGNRTLVQDWNGTWRFTYDELNRIESSQDAFSRTLQYEYDENGNLARIVYPNGEDVDLAYDARDQLATFTDFEGDASQFTYDPRGLLLRQNNPNDTVTQYRYDTVGQLIELINGQRPLSDTAPIQPQSAYAYTLDEEGNRTQIAEMRLSFDQLQYLTSTLTLTRSYSYNRLNWLTQADATLPTTGTNASTLYDFDLVGNRLSKEGAELTPDVSFPDLPVSGQPVTDSYRYNAANQLLYDGHTRYEYDDNGNRIRETKSITDGVFHIREIAYDYENHPVRVTESISDVAAVTVTNVVSYTYDGLGRRVKEEIANLQHAVPTTQVITYLYSQMALVGVEVESNGVVTNTYYGRAPGGQVLEVIHLPDTVSGFPGDRHWVQADGSGSIVGLTDEDGKLVEARLYGDYGDLLAGRLNLTTLSYTGQDYDAATGNYHFLFRDYDAAVGVWTTPDPYRGDVYDPGSQHRYQYVRNNPTTYVDPLGLFDWHTGAVEWGDTWESIAVQWDTSVAELKRLNPWVDEPMVGDYLQLPECRSAQCQMQMGVYEVRIAGMSGTACGQRLLQRQRQYQSRLAEQRRLAELERLQEELSQEVEQILILLEEELVENAWELMKSTGIALDQTSAENWIGSAGSFLREWVLNPIKDELMQKFVESVLNQVVQDLKGWNMTPLADNAGALIRDPTLQSILNRLSEEAVEKMVSVGFIAKDTYKDTLRVPGF